MSVSRYYYYSVTDPGGGGVNNVASPPVPSFPDIHSDILDLSSLDHWNERMGQLRCLDPVIQTPEANMLPTELVFLLIFYF